LEIEIAPDKSSSGTYPRIPAPSSAVMACRMNWNTAMSTVLIIVILILLFGGGGGYYGYNRYGGRGLGGALSIVLIILLVLWLAGGV
jgi:hypothetical protein